jgi:anaerobic magnesium-protoporphyrin IX monomethyl ester cyclase
MCSYNAPNQLLPPIELIALGGITRDMAGCTTHLIDAVAEELNTDTTIDRLRGLDPDYIVTLHGFECFAEDMAVLQSIKSSLPKSIMVLFGHYATLFPEEVLAKSSTDIIILGEPDNVFGDLMQALLTQRSLSEVRGIAYRTEQGVVVQKGDDRITHPEKLPMPAYELLKAEKYFEPFLKPPLGLIQSARGCPYNCNYCIRSFGKRLTYRTPQQIIDEIVFLKENYRIRSLRFIDDTFTVHTKRVIEVCQKMIEEKIEIDWTCLSRVDTLRPEMIPWMKKAGCKRIYFGIESGSAKVLHYLNKDVNMADPISVLKMCTKNGIETIGFFIVGAPNETREDFLESVNFAIEADLDYITVNKLIPYPGTPLFDDLQKELNFSLFPYTNEWKDPTVDKHMDALEKEFYKRFYFRWSYVFKNMGKVCAHPLEYLYSLRKLTAFLFTKQEASRSDFI